MDASRQGEAVMQFQDFISGYFCGVGALQLLILAQRTTHYVFYVPWYAWMLFGMGIGLAGR